MTDKTSNFSFGWPQEILEINVVCGIINSYQRTEPNNETRKHQN